MSSRAQAMIIPVILTMIFVLTLIGINVHEEYKDYNISRNESKVYNISVNTIKHTDEVVDKVDEYESSGAVFTLKSAIEKQPKYFELELDGDDGVETLEVWVGNKVRPLKLVGHKVTIGKYQPNN